MNIAHLKYAIEVEKTGSITRAAENLYMGQPNLSKAIRELENSVGIVIFKRTPGGVIPTLAGSEFLSYARSLVSQIDHMESMYRPQSTNCARIGISIPRASYITYAFTNFVSSLNSPHEMELRFNETNSIEAINDVVEGESSIGVIRYTTILENYFSKLISDKGLTSEPLLKFTFLAVMSSENPLCLKDSFNYEQLADYTELRHGDTSVPLLADDTENAIESTKQRKLIFLRERGSQFDLLSRVPNTYMWVSPLPDNLLQKHGLIQLRCNDKTRLMKDVLIYRQGYHMTQYDLAFKSELFRIRDILQREYYE